MPVVLSKTDYILYRECPKNVWYKIHKPEAYFASKLSEFEKSIMETGNEVELVARELFPTGALIEGRDIAAQEKTQEYLAKKQPTLFQAVFEKDGLLAAVDVLQYEKDSKRYVLYEIKATNDVDKTTHYHDAAFQINLLRKCGIKVSQAFIIHMNSEYVREGDLDIVKLFKFTDITAEANGLLDAVDNEAKEALKYISQSKEPKGYCCCVYKGRSRHCTTFQHSNPDVPEYSIHDIARIGVSKAKLQELVDRNIFYLDKIPDHIKLSDIQTRQVEAYVHNRVHVEQDMIAEELEKLVFPLYFLDYETFPAAIPRFDMYSPYHQIPFQYSVHILENEKSEPRHADFLHTGADDPSRSFADSLRQHIGDGGTIVVWHKSFENGRNIELGGRLPDSKQFLESINGRTYDLEDIFKKQYHVHKGYRGGTSIKKILPVLVPKLGYSDLDIQEGATAAESWNKLSRGLLGEKEQVEIIEALKTYCKRDTFAMYKIWQALHKLVFV